MLLYCRISSRKRGKSDEIDSDVQEEARRIHSTNQDTLVVKKLSKQYRLHNLHHILAVNDLSFGVRSGEVRQLLHRPQTLLIIYLLLELSNKSHNQDRGNV